MVKFTTMAIDSRYSFQFGLLRACWFHARLSL
jgi:hypothetical protein